MKLLKQTDVKNAVIKANKHFGYLSLINIIY